TLVAPGHASMGQVRHAQRTRDRHRAERPAHHWRGRRDLQSFRRPLAALQRHGCQLHGRRGEASVTATPWLWAAFTIAAAFAQPIRNAMQREIDRRLWSTHPRAKPLAWRLWSPAWRC